MGDEASQGDAHSTKNGSLTRPLLGVRTKILTLSAASLLLVTVIFSSSTRSEDTNCPIYFTPVAVEAAIERAEGNVDSLGWLQNTWARVEASFAEEFSCSFSRIYITEDQHGFYVYAKPRSELERDELIQRGEQLAESEFNVEIKFAGVRDATASLYEVRQAMQALKVALPNALIFLTPEEERIAVEQNRVFDPVMAFSDELGDIEVVIPNTSAYALLPTLTKAVDIVSQNFVANITIIIDEDPGALA